jgi:hypothetical protein
MAHIPTFHQYLDAITGGLRNAVTAFRTLDIEPDWTFLTADIDAVRTMLRRMNNATAQTQATRRGEKISAPEQLMQAIQDLTSALDAFPKCDRKKAAARVESALQALSI